MNPYQKLAARKRKWTPVQTEAGKCMEGAEGTIYRALALRHLRTSCRRIYQRCRRE
jgi:hypothetical protein